MVIRVCLSALLIVGFALAIAEAEEVPEERMGLPRLVHDTFDEAPAGWTLTDDTAWKRIERDGDSIFALVKRNSDYQPPVRSPFNRAIRDEPIVGDFVLDVKLRSTIPDYGHRDLCLFFGYQDEQHFYYVHFGKETDDHANQIFIVNEAPRTKISTKTTSGTPWTDDWHQARIVRNAATGKIEVYFDDMTTPAMTATDKTFPSGRVGIGSFDDTGEFDDFLLFGTTVKE